jgi:hypothetical protein
LAAHERFSKKPEPQMAERAGFNEDRNLKTSIAPGKKFCCMTTGELSSLARGRQENKPFM